MTKLGDYRKPLEEQAKDLGYDSVEDALKDGIITAVPTGEYKDFRLEIPDGKFSIDSLRFQSTIVSLEEWREGHIKKRQQELDELLKGLNEDREESN